jgi:hypothetical protein
MQGMFPGDTPFPFDFFIALPYSIYSISAKGARLLDGQERASGVLNS